MATDERILEEYLFFCDIEDELEEDGKLTNLGKFVIDRFKVNYHAPKSTWLRVNGSPD